MRFALPAAVSALVTAAVALLATLLAVVALGLQTAYLLLGASVAFASTSIAVYSVRHA